MLKHSSTGYSQELSCTMCMASCYPRKLTFKGSALDQSFR